MNKLKIVIVGNGMVGHHFIDQMLASKMAVNITVIGAETRPAYDRVHLSEVFSGKEPKDLALTTRAYYKFKQVPNGIEVSHIRPDLLRKLIEVHKGHSSSIVKTYEKAVGIFLFLIVLTGLYLAFTMKREKKLVVGLFLVGCLIFFFL